MTAPAPKISISGFVASGAEYAAIRERARSRGATSVIARLAPDGQIDLEMHIPGARFDRIRRITGYLVGTLDRFNDAKRAEENDRVKHSIQNASR